MPAGKRLFPSDSAFAAKVSLHVMTEKVVLINHLLLPAIHKGLERINNILACCFAGLLPVYRAFYRGNREGELEVVAPDCCVGTREQETEFASLARLDPTRDPVGIEISTLYLLRCFGFASRGATGEGWWMVDWPDADEHFSMGVSRLTRIHTGDPRHVRLTDPNLFDYPWIYATQTGW